MESDIDYHVARAMLEWQVEFGVTEAIADVPVNRFEVVPQPKAAVPAANQAGSKEGAGQRLVQIPVPPKPVEVDTVAEAQRAASGAQDLSGLKAAMDGFEHCELKRGARNLVFSDGIAGAPLMIIGEAPGRDEDREGRPFVGRAGQLLDKMLGAIDMSRSENVYITNVLPWRPPQNRDPQPDEIAMMLPFLERHVALAQPKVLVLMGNISCQAVLKKRGITRLRGAWTDAFDLPVLPMFHPAYLLRSPEKKREAWADLLSLKERLRG